MLALLAGGRPDVAWIPEHDASGLATLRASVEAAGVEVVEAARPVTRPPPSRPRVGSRCWPPPVRGRSVCTTGVTGSKRRPGSVLPTGGPRGSVPVGTPVIVTGNDPLNRLFNGDVGVVVLRDGNRTVAMGGRRRRRLRYLAPARLREWERWWAMTIHKSQGSEYPHAVVSLPPAGSPS